MLLFSSGHVKLTDFGLSKVKIDHEDIQVKDLIQNTPFAKRGRSRGNSQSDEHSQNESSSQVRKENNCSDNLM